MLVREGKQAEALITWEEMEDIAESFGKSLKFLLGWNVDGVDEDEGEGEGEGEGEDEDMSPAV